MKPLSSREIKNIELNILLQFAEFCRQNRLTYYLAGGTLLGAIRHKGFIPWDDDIDICMPRKDYLTMTEKFKGFKENLELRSNLKGNFSAPFTKIVDLNTKIDMKYTDGDTDTNLWIDIFPIDGLPDDMNIVRQIFKKCAFYRKLFMLCDAKLGEGTTSFKKYAKYILKPFAKIYGKKRCCAAIEKIAACYPYDSFDYVGAITWGLYGEGEHMAKKEYEKAVEVEFEGHMFPTFSCWHSYLAGLYGDYMTPPPENERKTHDMKAYLLEDGD